MPVNDSNLSCCGRGFDSPRLHHQVGGLAQSGEHLLCKQKVGGSSPPSSTLNIASVAQLVEHHVANVNVVGSNPITRSIVEGRKMHEEDKQTLKAVSGGIARAVLYICCTVFACLWLSNCTLDDETISNCEQSCNRSGAQMQSVTNRECVCTRTSSDMWVIPRQ